MPSRASHPGTPAPSAISAPSARPHNKGRDPGQPDARHLVYEPSRRRGETETADNQIVPQRNRALDGLRGIAALMVLVFHSVPALHGWPDEASLGGFGVRLFFVLSGALITSVLYRARLE